MIRVCFLLMVFSCGALAQQKRAIQNFGDVVVWTRGTQRQAKKLFGPGVNARILSSTDEKSKAGHLGPRQRDIVFRKVGIETKIAKLDEFAKDVLMLSAQEYSIRELKKDYPMLTEKQLKNLKSELLKAAKK